MRIQRFLPWIVDSMGISTGTQHCHGDVVAVDYLSGLSIAISESKRDPIQHEVAIIENRDCFKMSFRLEERITGASMISKRTLVLCTIQKICLCQCL